MSDDRNGDAAADCWQSCSSPKKRKVVPAEQQNNKAVLQKKQICKMKTQDLCNPLNYILNRQLNSKIDYCKSLVDARLANAENFFRKDLYSHYGCVNAIEFSSKGDLLISG